MATATVVETFDPLEPAGADELYRRLEAAEPRRVPRHELDGHVGLTSRELYELGCTLEPLTLSSFGEAFWWRLWTVVGILLATIGVARDGRHAARTRRAARAAAVGARRRP